jgi:hypothetical protein
MQKVIGLAIDLFLHIVSYLIDIKKPISKMQSRRLRGLVKKPSTCTLMFTKPNKMRSVPRTRRLL